MAYDFFESSSETSSILTIEGPTVELPDASYIRDAALQRDGMDLVLDGPHGTITVEGYFAAESAPDLTAEGGLVLSPKLVNSFVTGDEYAQAPTMNDASPVGAVDEISGDATITRTDGSVEKIAMGTPVYEGDVIETSGESAVNISFIDDTSFAVSNNARLAIDEYVFDPATESGSQNFSVLKGVFVFTSGLIGRDDPDDVNIDMPSGSIGIRGTIIAGDADSGEVTVVEGAIVVRDHLNNELTLDDRFETAKIDTLLGEITNLGQLGANDVSDRFDTLSNVSPTLFSSIEDAAAEEVLDPDAPRDEPADTGEPAPTEENFDADGTVDGDGDSDVDGTVEEGTVNGDESGALDPALENTDGVQETAALDQSPLITDTATKLVQGYNALKSGSSEGLLSTTEPLTAAREAPSLSTTQKTQNSGTLEPVSEDRDASTQNTVFEPQNPDTIEPLPVAGGGGGGAIPAFIRDAQMSGDAGFAAGDRFSLGQTNQPDTAFFRASSTQNFTYDLSNEFLDVGDTLTFALTNAVDSTGSVVNLNVTTTGALSFDVNTLGSNGSLTFDITVTDSGGQTTTAPFTIQLIASPGVNEAFYGNANDSLTLTATSNDTIHLGNGLNSVIVSEAGFNEQNVIFGGSNNDTFTLQYDGTTTDNFHNTFYGVDGNDNFIMQINGNMSFDSLAIKGGSGEDTLTLQDSPSAIGTAVLNFANLNAGPHTAGDITNLNIHGIERIDMTTGNANISLSAANVFEFTDFENELRIDGDAGDIVTLDGLTDTGTDSGSYDVYQGMHSGHVVTLLVDQTVTVV